MLLRFAVLVGGNSPEKMKWPWFAMVFNKVLAQAMYVAFFLGQYGAAVDPGGFGRLWYAQARPGAGGGAAVDAL